VPACAINHGWGKTTVAKARLLLLGLDPDIVDYSKSPVPGLTAAKVRSAVEADQAKLEALGYTVKTLYVDGGNTAEAVLADTLATGGYDCIMIGAGLRIVPPYFLLFEKLMNVIHQHAPASTKLCFNTSPQDTAEAVQHWV
jgi:hypothetical protein